MAQIRNVIFQVQKFRKPYLNGAIGLVSGSANGLYQWVLFAVSVTTDSGGSGYSHFQIS